MSIIEAKHAQEVRSLSVKITNEMITLMSDPTEYIEKGFWVFHYSDVLEKQLQSADKGNFEEAKNWVQLWLKHYGWKWNADNGIRPIDDFEHLP